MEIRIVLAVLAFSITTSSTQAQQPHPTPAAVAEPAPAALGLLNERSPLPGVVTGGAPDVAALERAAAAGFKTFVELRSDAERVPELEAKARELGLEVHVIAIAGPEDLDEANARRLGTLLASKRPLLLTCASGNRVGALLALEAAWVEGLAPAEAIELGKAAGLTRLEPVVWEKLGIAPAQAN